jgi:hypothetical protein
MEHVATRNQFCDRAPAAESIFGHLRGDSELNAMQLDFDYGLIDKPSCRAVAKFCSAYPARAVVWVTAATRHDGSWQITHSLQWTE